MQSTLTKKIAILDDDPTNFDIVKDLLTGIPEFEVLACAKNLSGFQKIMGGEIPEIVLLDINIESDRDGLRVLKWLRETHPTVKVIMMTASVEEISQCYQGGAQAYIVKGNWHDLVPAIQNVSEGDTVVPNQVAKHLIDQIAQKDVLEALKQELSVFTKRELELLSLLAHEMPRQKIIARMDISLFTYKRHVQNIRSKKMDMDIHSIVEKYRKVL